MRADITSWCRGCLTCATRHVGQAVRPLLTPIPVEGPFHRVGVDVLQLPTSARGNKYTIVFMDYLTKWPEVFPAKDQSAYAIAKTLVEKVIPRHVVPAQLLSDRRAAFLSKLLAEVYHLMRMKKVNTTAYHPQTNGLVERFNRTLLGMLSKTAKQNGNDWDNCLPFILFGYRSSPQTSTGESPSYLLYGKDPKLPTEAVICPPPSSALQRDADDDVTEITKRMSQAWSLAGDVIKKAQVQQKQHHDARARSATFVEGERVFVYMPATKSGTVYMLAMPFHGPYCVFHVVDNGVEVRPMDQPHATPTCVALNRVRTCPVEMPDVFWPRKDALPLSQDLTTDSKKEPEPQVEPTPQQTEWTSHLRPRMRTS